MAKYEPDEFFGAERNGCIPCPARETCFAKYRGSTCAARRSKYGLGDPKTNGDAIRAMSDEELAFILASPSVEVPPWCVQNLECPHMDKDPVPCDECALDWLKQEATE